MRDILVVLLAVVSAIDACVPVCLSQSIWSQYCLFPKISMFNVAYLFCLSVCDVFYHKDSVSMNMVW